MDSRHGPVEQYDREALEAFARERGMGVSPRVPRADRGHPPYSRLCGADVGRGWVVVRISLRSFEMREIRRGLGYAEASSLAVGLRKAEPEGTLHTAMTFAEWADRRNDRNRK